MPLSLLLMLLMGQATTPEAPATPVPDVEASPGARRVRGRWSWSARSRRTDVLRAVSSCRKHRLEWDSETRP